LTIINQEIFGNALVMVQKNKAGSMIATGKEGKKQASHSVRTCTGSIKDNGLLIKYRAVKTLLMHQ